MKSLFMEGEATEEGLVLAAVIADPDQGTLVEFEETWVPEDGGSRLGVAKKFNDLIGSHFPQSILGPDSRPVPVVSWDVEAALLVVSGLRDSEEFGGAPALSANGINPLHITAAIWDITEPEQVFTDLFGLEDSASPLQRARAASEAIRGSRRLGRLHESRSTLDQAVVALYGARGGEVDHYHTKADPGDQSGLMWVTTIRVRWPRGQGVGR